MMIEIIKPLISMSYTNIFQRFNMFKGSDKLSAVTPSEVGILKIDFQQKYNQFLHISPI